MECPQRRELLDWTSGRLSAPRKRAIDEHLDGCSACAAVLAEAASSGLEPEADPAASTIKMAPVQATRSEPREHAPAGALSLGETKLRAPTPPQGEAEAPPRFGRYVVIEQLGSGGMGEVFAAYDPELDRKVALKILRTDSMVLPENELRNRLLREAQAMARLKHPNVVAVYDVGDAENQIFVAMEFIVGRTLRAWNEERKRSWREVVSVFLEAGRGLAAAHRAGLIHRDFKPENVLVGMDGGVKVMDFGLVRTAAGGDFGEVTLEKLPTRVSSGSAGRRLLETPLTRKGMVLGTPAYMAPEQFREGPVDARADQFSFCVALFELLHGTRPFHPKEGEHLVNAITAGRLADPPEGVRVPGWIRAVLARGLAADPARRFESMEALLHALSRDPVARWRKVAIAGGAALALLAVGGVVYALDASRARACREADRVEQLWNPDRKGRIRMAFVQTGRPFAQDSWAAVERLTDSYLGGWVAARAAACEAGRLTQEGSDELSQARLSCLEQRFTAVSSLLALLERADAAIVERAASAVEALPSVTDCAGQRLLSTRGAVPTDPVRRAELERIRSELGELRVLASAGRVAGALERAEPLEALARRTGDEALKAEVLEQLGVLQSLAGEERRAREKLIDAAAAARAAGREDVEARVLTELAFVALELGYPADALAWGQLASAGVTRLGGDDALQARLEHALGVASEGLGRLEDAQAHLDRSAALREKAFGPESLAVAQSRSAIAATLEARGLAEAAAGQLERALAIQRRTLGEAHPSLANGLEQLANAQAALGDHSGAVAQMARAVEILEKAHGREHPEVGAALVAHGRHRLGAGDASGARDSFTRALELLRRGGPNHPALAEAMIGLGDTYLAREPSTAVSWYEQAVAALERSLGAASPKLSGPLRRIGQVRLSSSRPAEALAYLERANRLLEAAGVRTGELALTRFVLAQALWLERTERARALEQAESAKQLWLDLGRHAGDVAAVERWLAERR